ncbi:unnamed protein product [Prorocentrum cordatum]|uniref:4Fe-4S ferredoxin-type domain-containing protein n=1 Tax=Prorocentrum cordatum TaxID=2364126 RepID=A0ABN9Y324_9DINO|nr:unnamed protein product [Polarella glacialis]
MREVHEGGVVSCFCDVNCGECRMMCPKATDLKGALQAVIQAALSKDEFVVRGALISVDAGCIADTQVLREVLLELDDVFCCFPFGQQGMIGEAARHGNLMINVLLSNCAAQGTDLGAVLSGSSTPFREVP